MSSLGHALRLGRWPAALVAVGLVLAVGSAHAVDAPVAAKVGTLSFVGVIHEPGDISAIALREELLLLAADEGAVVQVLMRTEGGAFVAAGRREIELPTGVDGKELDLEGLAWGKDYAYAVGSHSRKRKTVEADERTAAKNIERLKTTADEPSREGVFRFKVDDRGRPEGKPKVITLRDIIDNDPILQRFQLVPSKENGIDIEGIAADGDKRLYIGFRGPVLRGNYVPVLVLSKLKEFKQKKVEHELRFVSLDGLGIRDMAKVEGGFLVLAGPVGDRPGGYRLYHWNGESCVPGTDEPDAADNARVLCEIPLPDGDEDAKAEGLAIVRADEETVRFIIVYDSAANGAPTVLTCRW